MCKCPEGCGLCLVKRSTTGHNLGRDFYKCPGNINTGESHRFVMWCDEFGCAKGSRSYERRVPNLKPRWTDDTNLEPLKGQIYEMKHEISMLKQDAPLESKRWKILYI